MMKAMWMLPLVCAGACTSSSDPAELVVGTSNSTVTVLVYRAWDHDFHGATATINGVAAGTPVIEPGREATIGNPEARALATFSVPIARSGGAALHVEVQDGGEQLTADAPDALVPRSVNVLTNLDQPLTSEPIMLATSSASDVIDPSTVIGIFVNERVCSYAGQAVKQGDAWAFSFPQGFSEWLCGTAPAAGTQLDATLDLTVNLDAQVTCSNADCLVSPVGNSIVMALPVRLQF